MILNTIMLDNMVHVRIKFYQTLTLRAEEIEIQTFQHFYYTCIYGLNCSLLCEVLKPEFYL